MPWSNICILVDYINIINTKLAMKSDVKNYSAPAVEVLDVEVEMGFSLSSSYGDYGEPGQGSDYNDSDFEL